MVGAAVVPNLFGEPTIVAFGGGKFDQSHSSGVSRAYSLVETITPKIDANGDITSFEQRVLQNWIPGLHDGSIFFFFVACLLKLASYLPQT